MKWIVAPLILMAGLVTSGVVEATAALSPVDDDTVKGVWESIDWEHATVFLLEIDNVGATLAVTNGSQPADTVYRSSKVRVKTGRVWFSGQEKDTGLLVQASGKGLASGDIGVLRLVLRTVRGNEPPWAQTELVFLKREKSSRLARLMAAEAQAAKIVHADSSGGALAKPPKPK